MLIAMFEAHTSTRAGAAPTNNRDLTGSGHTIIGWTDLLALDAHPRPSKPGEPKKTYASPADMKHRQLSRTLERLRKEELVTFPNGHQTRNAADGFKLMHEGGKREAGDNGPYTVPRLNEAHFSLPATFFTRGWVYCLEDSEIALLLWIASKYDAAHPETGFTMEAEARCRHYGINPNTYDKHRLLSALGLVDVTPAEHRNPDGTVYNYKKSNPRRPIPHTLRLLPGGFDEDAVNRLEEVLPDHYAST